MQRESLTKLQLKDLGATIQYRQQGRTPLPNEHSNEVWISSSQVDASAGMTRVPFASFDVQVHTAPNLSDIGKQLLNPHERKDNGSIEYTSLPDAILQWAEDPQGEGTFRFISNAYGIPPERTIALFQEAGMEEYLRHKSEGRFIGMVAAQIQKPTYYYLSDAFMLGALSRQGIPTALMIHEWPSDMFFSGNADKRGAFGRIAFPVGVKEKIDKHGNTLHQLEKVTIELRPYGIKHDDGRTTRITTIDQANGYRCDQILVQVVDAKGPNPNNQPYSILLDEQNANEQASTVKRKTMKTVYEAALGIHVPGLIDTRTTLNNQEITHEEAANEAISITDFYKILWVETINRLREAGDLPSEEEMPMFFVDSPRLYSLIAEAAIPPRDVLEILSFSSPYSVLTEVLHLPEEQARQVLAKERGGYEKYLASRNLRQSDNGLLLHIDGMMDPGSYYPLHTTLSDVDFDCLSCGGEVFVGKLRRAQEVRQAFGLSPKVVRIPDVEVPELEELVHPTGRYFTKEILFDERMIGLNDAVERIRQEGTSSGMTKRQIQELTKPLQDEIARLRDTARETYFSQLATMDKYDYPASTVFLPDPVAATYHHFLEGVPQAVASPEVQATIKRLTT